MFIYYLMARDLDPNRPDPARGWQSWVERFADGIGGVQTQVYKAWLGGDDLPTSQHSALGEHAALITFHTYADANRANRVFTDRLRLNAAGQSRWAVFGRSYKEVSSMAPVSSTDPQRPSQARMLPTDHHMYEVSRAVSADALVSLVDWHKEHLRWHCRAYGATDGSLLSAAGTPDSPFSYPYNVLAISWFQDTDSVNDMCSDLSARYQRGWPELARWELTSVRDQSPFSAV